MILCIDGSDIRTLVLEIYEWNNLTLGENGWRNTRGGTFEVSPEEFLATIAKFTNLEGLEGVVVVQGPGSATALRASLAIANTLAMTRHVPLYGVAQGTSWETVFTADGPKDGVAHLEPIYAHEARITPTKKDQLRRS